MSDQPVTNLLRNHDFLAPYVFPSEGHEDVQRITATSIEMIRVPNIRVPTGWTAFTYDNGEFAQIEMGLGDTADRLFGGHPSVKWFKYGIKHNAGLYQEVQLQPGRYVLRAWAHGWSNHPGACTGHESCKNQSDCSVGAGFAPYYAEAVPGEEPTGDPWSDGLLNMAFKLAVAIDGGPDIVGRGAHIYNAFHEVPALEFDLLEATTIVCGIGCETRWGFENANAYIGEISLERVGDQPTPPSGGLPRIQYERVVNVVPEGAGIERALEVLGLVWPQTVTNSYDDAGVGALDDKAAVLWDIPAEERSAFVDFYRQFYPGTVVEFDGDDEPPVVTPPEQFLLWQRNPLWANEKLAGRNCTATIGAQGCWVACCAMAQRFLSIDRAATPSTANKLLGPDGFSECRTNWSAMKRLGLEVVKRTTSGDAAEKWLLADDDNVAFVEVRLNNSEHWVFSGDVALYDGLEVYDPWKNVRGDLLDLYPAGPVSFRLVRKLNATPPPPPPPVQARNYMGLHLQTMVGGWDGYVRDTGTTTKVTASMQNVIGVKRVRPDVAVIWRHVNNDYGDTLENPDPLAGARRLVSKFSDSLYIECERMGGMGLTPPYFYVESVNEVYPPTARAVAFDRAFIVALAELGLPVAPVVMTAAVGNPHESEFPLLIPLARECAAAGGCFGYHAYWMANREDPDALTKYWQWLAGRWTEMDKVLVAAGVRVKWAFTESGAVGGQFVPAGHAAAFASAQVTNCNIEGGGIVKPAQRFVPIPTVTEAGTFSAHAVDGGFILLPGDGWLSSKCYGGVWASYLADMHTFNVLTAASVAGREGRVLGATIFTSGQGTGWEKFQIRDPEMQEMRGL